MARSRRNNRRSAGEMFSRIVVIQGEFMKIHENSRRIKLAERGSLFETSRSFLHARGNALALLYSCDPSFSSSSSSFFFLGMVKPAWNAQGYLLDQSSNIDLRGDVPLPLLKLHRNVQFHSPPRVSRYRPDKNIAHIEFPQICIGITKAEPVYLAVLLRSPWSPGCVREFPSFSFFPQPNNAF